MASLTEGLCFVTISCQMFYILCARRNTAKFLVAKNLKFLRFQFAVLKICVITCGNGIMKSTICLVCNFLLQKELKRSHQQVQKLFECKRDGSVTCMSICSQLAESEAIEAREACPIFLKPHANSILFFLQPANGLLMAFCLYFTLSIFHPSTGTQAQPHGVAISLTLVLFS